MRKRERHTFFGGMGTAIILSLSLFLGINSGFSDETESKEQVGVPSPAVESDVVPSSGSQSEEGTVSTLVPDTALSDAASDPTGRPGARIQVHGHWIIEVRDPDGTVVRHREFENALASPGPRLLAEVLSRTFTAGRWRVSLVAAPSPLCGASGCSIHEPVDISGPGIFSNLTVALGGGGDTVVLSGSVTADNDTSITVVNTAFGLCAVTDSPQVCGGVTGTPSGTLGDFSSSVVSPEIPVLTTQQVQVSVTLSFS
jgi:hypothetical protein